MKQKGQQNTGIKNHFFPPQRLVETQRRTNSKLTIFVGRAHSPRPPHEVVLAIAGLLNEGRSLRIVGMRIAGKGNHGASMLLRAVTKSPVDVAQSESPVVRVERRRTWQWQRCRDCTG